MYLRRVNDILINPELAIKQAKKEKCMTTTFVVLLFEWFLIALGLFLLLHRLNASAMLFFLGVVGTVFAGFLVQMVFTVLGGKGGYYEGVTSVVYSLLPMSASVVLSSIFITLPVFGVLLSFVVTVLFVLLGMTILYRAVKELFSTDMITAMVGIGILVGGITIALYAAFAMYAITTPNLASYFIPAIS